MHKKLNKGLAAGFLAFSPFLGFFQTSGKQESLEPLFQEVAKVLPGQGDQANYQPKGIGEHYRVKNALKYVVKGGDTIHTIARDMKKSGIWIKPEQIIAWNNLKAPYHVVPQQKLVLQDLVWEPQMVEASWYGPGFHGKIMANNAIFDQDAVVAAHMYLPLGMIVRVTNIENGNTLEVPITDRGNFEKYQRGIDLSKQAARILGYKDAGTALVLIEPLHSLNN